MLVRQYPFPPVRMLVKCIYQFDRVAFWSPSFSCPVYVKIYQLATNKTELKS